jgi:hypothetical protein
MPSLLACERLTQSFCQDYIEERDKGSPCLIPLDTLKVLVGDPFNKIEKKEVVTRFITQVTHPSSKPKAKSIFLRKSQFILS